MTAEPVADPGRLSMNETEVAALLARVPEDKRALLEAGRAEWRARRARGEAAPNERATRADWDALRARLATERAKVWRDSVPELFRDARVDNLYPDQHPDKLRAWWKSGARILYLRSEIVGNGKTHAAYAVANAVCDRFWVAARIVPDLMASQRQGDYDARAWRVATRCDLLILDDLGQEVSEGWEKEKARETLHRLLDTRARHGRRTIITTNRDGAWIERIYGSALADRLVHDSLPLVFEGPSRREVRDWGDL